MACPNCGANISGVPLRDDGDGSSSSTNADETISSHLNNSSQYNRAVQVSEHHYTVAIDNIYLCYKIDNEDAIYPIYFFSGRKRNNTQ